MKYKMLINAFKVYKFVKNITHFNSQFVYIFSEIYWYLKYDRIPTKMAVLFFACEN